MQAMQSPTGNLAAIALSWLSHNVAWFGAILLAFFMGMGYNNGEATKEAVSSVQGAYQGKLEYHLQREKQVATVAEKAAEACQHNATEAVVNEADPRALKACPKPPAVK